jgi:hypothetical protein
MTDDDRELRNDKGQTCAACGEHFKYQYLYDDHWPCPAARPVDPTTASIAARSAEHDQLRRLLDAEKEQCSRMSVSNAEAMKILGGSYPDGIVERAQAVVDERDQLRAEVARLRLQHDGDLERSRSVEVFVLLMDDAGTSRSSDELFGVAVTTEEEAKRFVRDGGVGYSHSYAKVRVFADKDAALRHDAALQDEGLVRRRTSP